MTINPSALDKFKVYKKLLMMFNIPIVIFIPLFCEFVLDFTHPKANLLYALLYTADTFLFVNAYMIYKMIKGAIMSIDYLVKEDKFEIKHFSTISQGILSSVTRKANMTSKNTEIVAPGNIAKAPKALVNPFYGYRNIETDSKYITEGMCTWYDRHFFDSVLERAKEQKGPKISEEVKRKRQNKKGSPFD